MQAVVMQARNVGTLGNPSGLVGLQVGIVPWPHWKQGTPGRKRRGKQGTKAVWLSEDPGQEEPVMVTAVSVVSGRSRFRVRGEVF